MPDIFKLYIKAQKEAEREASEAEAGKAGKLRGGNSGAFDKDSGAHIGSCMAKTYLRFKGVSTEKINFQRHDWGRGLTLRERSLMFEAGVTNEDSWVATLTRSWVDKKKERELRCEEDTPTKWTTDSGINVTGRPDIVLYEKGKPVTGLELKLVSSLWTARDVLFKGQPKTAHVLQAAHYSWQLGCPFEIWYTSRADFHIGQMSKLFPDVTDEKSQFMQFGYYRLGEVNKKTGKRIRHRSDEEEYSRLAPKDRARDAIKVLPFIQGFKLRIQKDGLVQYSDAMLKTNKWHDTVVNINHLKDYYEKVSELDIIPDPPETVAVDGTPLNYKAAQYCELAALGLCCAQNVGRDAQDWADNVKEEMEMQD